MMLCVIVPGPPVGILFPEVRTASVRLIWQPPAQPNGIILGEFITYRLFSMIAYVLFGNVRKSKFMCIALNSKNKWSNIKKTSWCHFLCQTLYWFGFVFPAYQIIYRRNSSNSNAATVDVLSPSARQYTATGLKPEMVYVFRLTAQTRKGWGEAAEALVVTTEKRGKKLQIHVTGKLFTTSC